MKRDGKLFFALHILAHFADAGSRPTTSDELAAHFHTNPVVIRRLLGQLSQANLVESQTGAAGGTRLARCPKEITLAEIYKAVSCGEVFALHGRSPNQNCPVGRNIEAVLCSLQKEIDKSIGEKLSQYTLQSVLEIIEQGKS